MRSAHGWRPLVPDPRVILMPGVGLFSVGTTYGDATIAADIAESNIAVISPAEAIGRFETISEHETLEMEYWSLEQAKLGKANPRPLAGQIVVITGGGGTIGAAIARAFAAEGAEVAVLDRDRVASTRRRCRTFFIERSPIRRPLCLTCAAMNSPAMTWRVRRISHTLWSIRPHGRTSWIRIEHLRGAASSGTRPAIGSQLAAKQANHWLALLLDQQVR